MSDVMEQSGGADQRAFVATYGTEFVQLLEQIQRAAREMQGPKCMLEECVAPG